MGCDDKKNDDGFLPPLEVNNNDLLRSLAVGGVDVPIDTAKLQGIDQLRKRYCSRAFVLQALRGFLRYGRQNPAQRSDKRRVGSGRRKSPRLGVALFCVIRL